MNLVRAKTSFMYGRLVVGARQLVEATHPMVRELPDMFEPLRADFPTPPGPSVKAEKTEKTTA